MKMIITYYVDIGMEKLLLYKISNLILNLGYNVYRIQKVSLHNIMLFLLLL